MEDCTFSGGMEDVLLDCLDALHFKPPDDTKLLQEHFRGRQAPATVRQVLHFLYYTYDKKAVESRMRNIWPVKTGESDKRFREEITQWISTLQGDELATPYIQEFSAALLLRPGTPQCSKFLASLSVFVLHYKLKDSVHFSSPFSPAERPAWKLEMVKKATIQTRSQNAAFKEELDAFESEKAKMQSLLEKKRSDLELSIKHLQAQVQSFESDDTLMSLEKLCRKLRAEERDSKKTLEIINEAVETFSRSKRVIDLSSLTDKQSKFLSSSGLVDVVGTFKDCTELAKKLSAQFVKEGCTQQDLEAVKLRVAALRATLRRLQEQRETAKAMKAEIDQRLSAGCKKPFVVLNDKDIDEMCRPAAQPATKPDVEEFVNELLAVHRSQNRNQ
ncbi:uncharacterized protein LOC144126254 isoform X2 [Amblyomma americanum]